MKNSAYFEGIGNARTPIAELFAFFHNCSNQELARASHQDLVAYFRGRLEAILGNPVIPEDTAEDDFFEDRQLLTRCQRVGNGFPLFLEMIQRYHRWQRQGTEEGWALTRLEMYETLAELEALSR